MRAKTIQMFIFIAIVASACTKARNTDAVELPLETPIPSETLRVTDSIGEITVTPISSQPTSDTPTPDLTPTLPTSTEQGISLKDLVFTSNNCALPCWHSIVPGISTDEEVTTELQNLFGIDLTDAQHFEFQVLPTTSDALAREYYYEVLCVACSEQ